MPVVNLTVSKTLGGSAVADVLTGGSQGYNMGTSEAGNANPQTYDWYLRHNGGQEITNLAAYVKQYSGVYGGEYSASADLTKLIAHGDALAGFQMDMDWDTSPTFSGGAYTTFKTNIGTSLATRQTIAATAMVYDNSGTETSASSPVSGQIGPAGNTVLGSSAHFRLRYVNPSGEAQPGKRQFDVVFVYNYTS